MWTKLDNGKTVNLETGQVFDIRYTDDDRLVRTWEVYTSSPNLRSAGANGLALKTGYKTEEEARAALDDFLSSHKIKSVQVQPPVTEEEIAEESADESAEESKTEEETSKRGTSKSK